MTFKHGATPKSLAPNLVIAGVQKGGTTWLHNMLRDHPDIFMTEQKELGFFNKSPELVEAGFDNYLQHFSPACDEIVRGESTPHYFWKKEDRELFGPKLHPGQDAAGSINEYLSSDTKIIIMLRDPVSRAISAYHHHFAMGRNKELRTIFDCDPRWGVIDLGFYRRHMSHWDGIFGSRIKYCFF